MPVPGCLFAGSLRPGVPPFERGLPFVFTEYRHCACVEQKLRTKSEVEPEPPHGQRSQGMAVAEADRLIDTRSTDPSDHSVKPPRNLPGRLSPRSITVPDRPARNRLPDLLAGLTLIVTVEPFGKVVVDLRLVRANESSQLRRLAGSSSRTAKDQLEVLWQEVALQGPGQLLAGLGERQVGDRGMPARPTPFGLAVADEVQARWHPVHRIAPSACDGYYVVPSAEETPSSAITECKNDTHERSSA
jgi:hypothetical protein